MIKYTGGEGVGGGEGEIETGSENEIEKRGGDCRFHAW